MSAFCTYLLSVASASLLTGVVLSLLPKGRLHSIIRLVGALILIVTVVSPVLKLDTQMMPVDVGQIRTDVSDIQQNALEEGTQLFSQIIKEQCEAYISDRADSLGLALEVEITMDCDDHPYPIGVKIQGHIGPEDKRYMSAMIEQDLGIPTQQQEWIELE